MPTPWSRPEINFISPGFPSEPITNYLEQNYGELLATPIRILDRFNIQTGTRVFKYYNYSNYNEKNWKKTHTQFFFLWKIQISCKVPGPENHVRLLGRGRSYRTRMPKKANMRVLAKTTRLQRRMPKSPTETQNPLTLPEPLPTTEEAAKSFERDQPQKNKEHEVSKRPFSDSCN